ncbi:expressed protein [Chlorella variabilis]|uniref:Expressed protein n=1 Tax=Chlorella variabilis TaxID=554065 RepID=E1ZAF0_CHLVA|nr:expressed protein [Chlorella variabilis]EFN57248.1 expressed protein [Chlorella variabilis]|eukprot:XP_005849350.1 expressed protein [Chlorella variabilis]
MHSSSQTAWGEDTDFSGASGAAESAGGGNGARLSIRSRPGGNRRQATSLPSTAAVLAAAREASAPRAGGNATGGSRGGGGTAGTASHREVQVPGGGASAPGVRPGQPPNTATVFVTFGNTAMWEFTHNWALSVQRLGAAYLVGALDAGMSELCAQAGLPHLDLWRQQEGNAAGGSAANSSFFRADFRTFRNMGAAKIQLTLSILEGGGGVDTVVVSDSDTVWLRHPQQYFDQRPAADWFISTDCLSHEVEAAWRPQHNQPRCGHVPGNIWGRAYNTGVFAVRNREAGRRLLRLWRDLVLGPEALVQTEANQTFGVTDQQALNMLLEEGSEWKLDAAPEDDHITLMRNGTLRLHPLPILLFPSGHVAFVQRLPWRHGAQPYVVHATFQRYGTSINRYAKRARFRHDAEFGMWFLDGPEYYAPPGARYLAYSNDVRRFIGRLAAERFKGAMPVLYKQMAAMSYQLAQFRDALAAARMLNRTLVLPTSWCWCDYDWTPHVLEKCKIRVSDLRLPFECPSDFVLHIPYMEMAGLEGRYRVPGFLEDPRAPAELRLSRGELRVLDAAPALEQGAAWANGVDAAAGAAAAASTAASDVAKGELRLGAAQREIEDVAAPLREVAVLQLSNMQPGLVAGFDSADEARAFDDTFQKITEQLYWCCAAEESHGHALFHYKLPRSLSAGYRPWTAPVMLLPGWCDQPEPNQRNREALAYANHPCQFLTNATAAAIAAAIS